MKDRRPSKSTHLLSLTALFTALVAATTLLLKVPMPPIGYFNLGDVMVLFASLLLPLRFGVFVAGVGSLTADLMGGYAQYAVFTLFIKGLQVIVIYGIRKLVSQEKHWIAYFTGSIVMALLYAAVDGLLLQNAAQFVISFGYNIIQGFTSTCIFLIFYKRFERLVDQLRSLDT